MPSKLEKDFILLIDHNKGIINSLCRVYSNQNHDYHDARQEVILQLWRAYPDFRQASKVSTWVYKVCLNTLLNRKRSQKFRPEVNISEAMDLPSKIYSTYCDDDIRLLYEILDQLIDIEKAIVILHLEGYKYREIAEIVNLSPTAISTKMSRIKKRLSIIFKSLNYEL